MGIVTLVRNRLEKQDRSSHHRCSFKKRVLKIFAKFTGKTCARASFLIKFVKKETLAQVLSCEFCENLRTIFLQNTSGRLLLTRHSIQRSCSDRKKSSHCFQKQPPEVFHEKTCSQKFTKFTVKHLCQSLFLINCRPEATLLKKRLQHSCFRVNFAKFLRTLFLTEHLQTTASLLHGI